MLKRILLIICTLILTFTMINVGGNLIISDASGSEQSRHSGDILDCPHGTTPTLNGVIGSGEWDDATSIAVSGGGGNSGTIYFKEDTAYLYVLFDYNVNAWAEVYVDTNNDGGGAARTDDFFVHSSWSFGAREGTGSGWGSWQAGGNDDWDGNTGDTDIREFKISYSKLGLTSGTSQTIGIMFRFWASSGSAVWPSGADTNVPNTWGDMESSDKWGIGIPPNALPILRGPAVTPPNGDIFTDFMFNVTYLDLDDDEPKKRKIIIDGTEYNMNSPDKKYDDGSNFKYEIQLEAGDHEYYFLFNDSKIDVRLPLFGSYSGPSVAIPNDPPELLSGGIPNNTFSFDEDSGGGDNLIDLEEYFYDDWDDGAMRFELIYEEDMTKLDGTIDGQYLDFEQIQADWFGSKLFKVKAIDKGIDFVFGGGDDLETVSNYFSVTVNPINDEPILEKIGYTNVVDATTVTFNNANAALEDKWFNFTIEASDGDIQVGADDTLTFAINSTLITIEADPDEPLIATASFLPDNSHVGIHYFQLTVSDKSGTEPDDTIDIVLEVKNTNDKPFIEKVEKFNLDSVPVGHKIEYLGGSGAFEGRWFNLTVIASDPDIDIGADDAITFETDTMLPNFDLDPVTGEIYFLPYQEDVGRITVQINIMDNADRVIDDYVDLIIDVNNVNDPPGSPHIIIQPSGYTFLKGEDITFKGTCMDPDMEYDEKEQLTYIWDSNQVGEIGTGSEFSIDIIPVGTHNITLTVTDFYGAESSAYVTITIEGSEPGSGPDDSDESSGLGIFSDSSNLWIITSVLAIIIVVIALLIFMTKSKKLKSEPIVPESAPGAQQYTAGSPPGLQAGAVGSQAVAAGTPAQLAAQPQAQVSVEPKLLPAAQPMPEPQPQYQAEPSAPVQPQSVPVVSVDLPGQQPSAVQEPEQRNCSTCGQPLSHIAELNQHYCYQCRKYE